jgi:Flp pilus assembly pilin Flp
MNRLGKFLGDERGAGLAEYVFLTALIAAACLIAVAEFGGGLQAGYDLIVTAIRNAIGG